MTRLATSFTRRGDLIVVRPAVRGPRGTFRGIFLLDTGAAVTTMTHDFAGKIGYGVHDGLRPTTVRTAVGAEHGYVLRVAAFTALGFTVADLEINTFDLDHDIDGLIGMNFLIQFNYDVRSLERRILVEPAQPGA